jgi:hypothetical protein
MIVHGRLPVCSVTLVCAVVSRVFAAATMQGRLGRASTTCAYRRIRVVLARPKLPERGSPRPDAPAHRPDQRSYLRLIDSNGTEWQNRAYVFAVAAKVMSRVLVSQAVARHRRKRSGSMILVSLTEAEGLSDRTAELLGLDEAPVALGKDRQLQEQAARGSSASYAASRPRRPAMI